MRKDDAVAELITPPVLLANPWPHLPISRPYPREHVAPINIYFVRRPNMMAHSGASNLKWKRSGASLMRMTVSLRQMEREIILAL